MSYGFRVSAWYCQNITKNKNKKNKNKKNKNKECICFLFDCLFDQPSVRVAENKKKNNASVKLQHKNTQ